MTTTPTPAQRIYIFPNGEKVRSATAVGLIEYLRQQSFDDSKTLEDYMFKFSDRCLLSLHTVIRIDTPENFVEDLQKSGIVVQSFPAN